MVNRLHPLYVQEINVKKIRHCLQIKLEIYYSRELFMFDLYPHFYLWQWLLKNGSLV